MKTITRQLAFLICQCVAISSSYGQYQMPEQGLCAHRGAMETHPENTIPAFQAAIHAGAQMIELDVQFTKDSIMVVMHDTKVDRTTNGSGQVAGMLYEDIRGLFIVAATGQEHPDLKIPTLEESLSIMPKNIWINCHLKGGDVALAREVAGLILKQGRVHQAFLACNRKEAQAARDVVPDILICNMETADRKSHAVYVSSTLKHNGDFLQFHSNASHVGEELTVRLKKQGVKSNYFRAFKPEELEGLFKSGVDFILVNDIVGFMPRAEELGISRVKPIF